MSSLHSMNDLGGARRTLERLSRDAYRELGLPLPDVDPRNEVEQMRRYLSRNPDITPQQLAQALAELEDSATLLPNVVDLSAPPPRSILNSRVQAIASFVNYFDAEQRFMRTCFTTFPAGGLDASSFKLEGSENYAVIIPEGFFHLTNLLTKLVILLHPITQTSSGPVFMPSASFDQIDRMEHPYVMFRHRDLLEGFFLWGDPKAALPYTFALPFQDRFAYLLDGTELFVLAHELAHVLLGHLDRRGGENGEALELEADALALEIVTAYFRATTDYPVARASLCGLLFISMVKMWETGLEHLTGDDQIAKSHTHPISSARFQRFAQVLENSGEVETPPWYIHTHNAIRYLTGPMVAKNLNQISEVADTCGGLSARVLPQKYRHLGHFNIVVPERWWIKIARMITSTDSSERRIGLWLLVSYLPVSAVGIYRGIVDEDDVVREQCEAALLAIEPMYESYIPRLRERFRETAQVEEFEGYLYHLSTYLGGVAKNNLGGVSDMDPMDPRFFDGIN